MPLILTSSSTITCNHAGSVGASGGAKLTIARALALVIGDIQGKSVDQCSIQDNTNTGTLQCKHVLNAQGVAKKLTTNSVPVALASLSGKTDGFTPGPPPAGVGSISAQAGQSKFTAV